VSEKKENLEALQGLLFVFPEGINVKNNVFILVMSYSTNKKSSIELLRKMEKKESTNLKSPSASSVQSVMNNPLIYILFENNESYVV